MPQPKTSTAAAGGVAAVVGTGVDVVVDPGTEAAGAWRWIGVAVRASADVSIRSNTTQKKEKKT